MHDIEPFYGWRHKYTTDRDKQSPFYNREYSEFAFSNTVYNYFVHPQWDAFGSPNLYIKILYVDVSQNAAILEMIGEWNDCISNDIMILKTQVLDILMQQGIYKFAIIMENVLNFHCDDSSYYEEWYEEIQEYEGWICLLQPLQHVEEELYGQNLHYFLRFNPELNTIPWRTFKPEDLITLLDKEVFKGRQYLV